LNENQDEGEIKVYKERIQVFQNYLKKVIGIMEIQKQQLKKQSDVREKHDTNQSGLMFQLMKYEDIATAYYSD
jgi:hypothetical protein